MTLADSSAFGREEQQQTGPCRRLLFFQLGQRPYCVDVFKLAQAIRPAPITIVPNVPEYVAGVMNLRGEILPVIDLHCLLALNETEHSSAPRILVAEHNGMHVGFLVDRIRASANVPAAAVQPPLATVSGNGSAFVSGQVLQQGEIATLLDFDRIVDSEELKHISRSA